jgi:hypothetical protein
VAAHVFRRAGGVSVASQPSPPVWDALLFSRWRLKRCVQGHTSVLAAKIVYLKQMRRAEETNSCHFRN